MNVHAIRVLTVSMVIALVGVCAEAADLELKKDDHIAFIGNSLPDRLQHDGWLESYLHAAHPDKNLVIRNMGFTGDQVSYRPRNQNFMTADAYLEHTEADVIFAFFGYNESFAQDPDEFKNQVNTWIEETREKKYNGESAPRIVLISPIAYENLDDPNLPDGEELNEWLATYTDAMASVARRQKVPFIDLYYPSEELYEESDAPLTINGVHLNSAGTKAISKLIADELLGDVDTKHLDAIRASVKEKNWTWFNRYRATDGNDVWGSRAELSFVNDQTNEVVLQHELKMLDIMSENRDRVTWSAANGRTVRIDDSNVPDPIQVITNIEPKADRRAEDGGHKFVPPEEGPDTLKLQDGLEVNLFASEEMFPEMVNPVQLDVDTKGRLWAAVWQTYPKWQPDLEMNDQLVILEDTDRDGVADNLKSFAHVHNPTGFTFWNGGVLVASAPEILFLKDTDGDDVADVREVWLSGIDSSDTHHSANGFDYGPDGYVYYQRGIFNVANVETPWQTAQLNGQSAMYRWNPRTHRFSYHAENPPNPHGGDFDYWGYHYATSATGGEAYQIRQATNGKFRMYKLLDKTVRPVPSSGIISSQHLPEKMNGNFIILNSIGFLGIKQYTLENTDGVVWGTETNDLLISNDSNFRPTDFKIGEDGALYVSDWANPIIGHMQHNIRDPNRDHRHGRIYRVTAKGRPLQEPVKIDGESIPALLDVLKHPVDGVRLRARIELSERDTDEVIAATKEWMKQWDFKKKKDAHHLLEALWVHQQHNVFDEAFLNKMLEYPEPHAQRAAMRVKYMWELEGKYQKKTEKISKSDDIHAQHAALQAARDEYLRQEPSPDPVMDGDTMVIHIQTVKEQMRYDRTEIYALPGQKVRIVFKNPDAMDHNMILTQPDTSGGVAAAALKMETTGEGTKKEWNPGGDNIIWATGMLAHNETQTVEFTVPMKQGDYVYLCTFPGHAQLMRGTLKVRKDYGGRTVVAVNKEVSLATEDIIVSNRSVVEYWEFDSFADDLGKLTTARNFNKGQEMFELATCSKCHTLQGAGQAIGPDLTKIGETYTSKELLEHILDPSLKVDDEYKTYIVETKDNKEYFGTLIEQNDRIIRIAENVMEPDKAVTVKRHHITVMDAIDISPMPSDLLITMQKEEVLDLIAYVFAGGSPSAQAFKN